MCSQCICLSSVLQYVTVDYQQLRLKAKHEPKQVQQQIEAEYAAAAKLRAPRRPFEDAAGAAPGAWGPAPTAAQLDRRARKRFVRPPMCDFGYVGGRHGNAGSRRAVFPGQCQQRGLRSASLGAQRTLVDGLGCQKLKGTSACGSVPSVCVKNIA
jgi:hypothetical protein